MIYKKAKQLLGEFRQGRDDIKTQNEQLRLQLAELEWANIFHDTIKDREWLRDTAISPGRWAGNYSFFYVLVRILSDCKPNRILELGLGESSKIVSSFLRNELPFSSHLIIEQDLRWMESFNSRFSLGENSTIINLPLITKTVKGFDVRCYEGIENKIQESFDFYLVDGPFGSARFSRYQICALADILQADSEFIILIDDYNRQGEQETVQDLIALLEKKGIEIFTGEYRGTKSQLIITTAKYRLAVSL